MRTDISGELAALYQEHGGLEPHVVVDWAEKHPDSALHGRFLWDDSKAAQEYRLYQARKLIVEVTAIYPDQKPHQVYVSPIESRGNGGYVALVDVLSDKQRRAKFLAQALAEYERLGQKYEGLKELAGVREAVRKASGEGRRRKTVNGVGLRG